MIDAKIIEWPGREQAGPAEPLERCTKRLSSTELNYYCRRAAQEAGAAQDASCTEARRAHEEMAKAYRLLCRSHRISADPHLAPELSVFLFNSKPTY